ncbi:hypothetical protein BD626DRAFT_580420 [Schizophyllum amplum]|uniref:Uncharacterized protein n=1 Tax=Schizophyllum amplum TaxID=97359 RepID=A0A550CZS5_9AGAR|nr:hypothetical protein BD626DRAFT_580420 [Auriculariopsis ampla]
MLHFPPRCRPYECHTLERVSTKAGAPLRRIKGSHASFCDHGDDGMVFVDEYCSMASGGADADWSDIQIFLMMDFAYSTAGGGEIGAIKYGLSHPAKTSTGPHLGLQAAPRRLSIRLTTCGELSKRTGVGRVAEQQDIAVTQLYISLENVGANMGGA